MSSRWPSTRGGCTTNVKLLQLYRFTRKRQGVFSRCGSRVRQISAELLTYFTEIKTLLPFFLDIPLFDKKGLSLEREALLGVPISQRNMSATQPLDFRTARLRLVERINHLVHSGQLTERRLARLTGVSQPHIHNILKGIRTLTPDVADLVLEHLDLDLLDLFERERIDSHP